VVIDLPSQGCNQEIKVKLSSSDHPAYIIQLFKPLKLASCLSLSIVKLYN